MKESYEIKIDDESKIKVRITGSRFSMVYLMFTDRWIDIARIDNYPHNRRIGTHIHRYCEERVEFRELTVEEAMETLKNIGNNTKERIKDGCYRNR